MENFDSILNLKSKSSLKEDVDFTLQKERIKEAFENLLDDLKALETVEAYLKNQTKDGEHVWKELLEVATGYTKFQKLLKDLYKKAKGLVECTANDPTTKLIRDTIKHVEAVSERSMLHPPSPPIIIKNRAEYETFRWKRVIALQNSKMESLNRKIEEFECKINERMVQRQRLHQRSETEKEDQLNASQHILVEMKLEGDGAVQRLQDRLASQPNFETTPEYLSQLDKHELKRKRIAKMEVQLQLWIKKYDKFIGEPMPSLLALEGRMAGLDEWRDTVLRPQEERLHQLREQIGAFEAVALEEKIEEMRKLHAVRVLQRALKRTLEIRHAKKKGKKSKKGKGK
uniref:Dynein regulatory complex protein 10 n=1 Tax=Anopheles maculatus TaxID=74869 RepID=A0A182SAC1_9DIPT